MIKNLTLQKQGESYVLQALKSKSEDQIFYMVELIHNEKSLNYNRTNPYSIKTKLTPAEGRRMISYDFKLERGLYDVYITELVGSSTSLKEETRQQYPGQLVAGEKYRVDIKIKDDNCYGPGTKVGIKAYENGFDSHTLYYLLSTKEHFSDLKYYIPFDDKKPAQSIFFIAGVAPNELEFKTDNPLYELNVQRIVG